MLDYLIKWLDIDVVAASVGIIFYRDNFEIRGLAKSKQSTSIDVDINGRRLIMVDDVVHSGRTARTAFNELLILAGCRRCDWLFWLIKEGANWPSSSN
ncbi:MAG: hypothetical protein O3A65_06190 [Proteobacteria bacterium]|nr:hypothetical protein [Pseudomonadota bacterium]